MLTQQIFTSIYSSSLGVTHILGQRSVPASRAFSADGLRRAEPPGSEAHMRQEGKRMNEQSTSPRMARLGTPSALGSNATRDIANALNTLLADIFALYLKTKNFHWHVSGPHFRDFHLLLDEQSEQIFAVSDELAERVRKIGGTTLRSIAQVGRLQRIVDNEADYVAPLEMLAELRDDNGELAGHMREAHELCEQLQDVATASLLENWIDEAERRVWFLCEATRNSELAP